jgi:transposase
MASMESYSKAAMERAMKVQEVILRAIAKKITWWQAAEIIGISDRQMRRWRERYGEFGFDGLLDRRRCRPSEKRVPLARVEQVLELYRDRYFDLNVRHFHEKLVEEHGIGLSYSWVKAALQGAGLVARGRKRGVHRKRRARRPLPGMLLHIDGSRHRWFQDERWHDLIVILDDASSEIYYAQLVEEESTTTVLAALREVVERKGVFCALYSDRGSHFWLTPQAGGKVDPHRLTQVGRALRELGVQMIPAYSPQARGRSERSSIDAPNPASCIRMFVGHPISIPYWIRMATASLSPSFLAGSVITTCSTTSTSTVYGSEKKIARTAFDAALRRELEEVVQEAKQRAGQIKEPSDLWDLENYLTRRRKEINSKYDSRGSRLTHVLGKLLYEGRLGEEQLRGLSQHQLDEIRSYKEFLAEVDTPDPGT